MNTQKELNNELLEQSSSGNLELVKELLAAGADIKATDKDGRQAIHIAVRDDHFDIVKYLVENGADINAQTKTGWSALHYTGSYERLEILKYLIEKGADLNITDVDGWTPLYTAYYNNMVSCMLELLKHDVIISPTVLVDKSKYVFEALHTRMEGKDKLTSVIIYLLQKRNAYTNQDFFRIIKFLLSMEGIPDNLRILLSAFLP